MPKIRAVFFDVGETLVDETRQWGTWADWLSIPRLTFFAAFGAVVARGDRHRAVFDYFVPGLDIAKAEADRAAAGVGFSIEAGDLYADALPCIASLREMGVIIGIAGNQPEGCEAALAASGVSADYIASSARWGIEKPSQCFFERISQETGLLANQIAYVGDRLDNDVLPAAKFGMTSIFIERGPWGFLHASKPEVAKASARIRSLLELPEVLSRVA